MPKERNAYFICEQFGTVLEQFKDKAKSWLDRYGNVLKELGMKGLKLIKADIEVAKDKLKQEANNIDDLKRLLNYISEIKNMSMQMELNIAEVTEKFRILKMYNQTVEVEKMEEAFGLQEKWNELVIEAKKKDIKLGEEKKKFSEVTQQEVADFKEELKKLHARYVSNGPGS
jgi:dynein heavy chain